MWYLNIDIMGIIHISICNLNSRKVAVATVEINFGGTGEGTVRTNPAI